MKYYILAISITLALVSCKEKVLPPTNMLYENISDDKLKGKVKEVDYLEGDQIYRFNEERNLSQIYTPSSGKSLDYLYTKEQISFDVNKNQKVIIPLDSTGRVTAYISKVLQDSDWKDYYKEDWSFDEKGRLVQKFKTSKAAKKKDYFINRLVYVYYPDGKLEIKKYGWDKGTNTNNGMLRSETRIANEKGDWVVIEELDEDGIPYRKANNAYEYDSKGNWIQCIVRQENNYTGQSSVDTINRKITYR